MPNKMSKHGEEYYSSLNCDAVNVETTGGAKLEATSHPSLPEQTCAPDKKLQGLDFPQISFHLMPAYLNGKHNGISLNIGTKDQRKESLGIRSNTFVNYVRFVRPIYCIMSHLFMSFISMDRLYAAKFISQR